LTGAVQVFVFDVDGVVTYWHNGGRSLSVREVIVEAARCQRAKMKLAELERFAERVIPRNG